MRTVYWLWSTLMVAAIVVQIGFAGYGAFYTANKLNDEGSTIDNKMFEHGFTPHAAFGYFVILGGLIFVVIGLIAGVGKWRLGRQGVLALLLILQMFLAWFGFDAPPIGFFHPINAFVILGLAGWIAWDEWQRRRAGPPIPAPAT